MKHFNTLYIVLMGLLINCSAAWGMDQSSLLGSPESSQVLPLLINEPNDDVKLAITNQNGSYFNNNFPALINAVPYYMEHAQDDHKSNKNAMNALQIMYYHPESKDKELIFDTLNEIGAGKPVSPILTQKILQPYQGTQVPQLTQIPRIPQIPKNQTLNFDTKLSNINKELKDIQENKILTNKEKLRQINDLYKKLNLIRPQASNWQTPETKHSLSQIKNWLDTQLSLQQAHDDIKNPQKATTLALQSSGFQVPTESQQASLDLLSQSEFHQPSEDELLEQFNITANNIVKALEKLPQPSKVENLTEIKKEIEFLIISMIEQIKNLEKDVSVTGRLLDLQKIHREIARLTPETDVLDTEILIVQIREIQQTTIDNIKNKGSLDELQSSRVRIDTAVENMLENRNKKYKIDIKKRLKKIDENLKKLARQIKEGTKKIDEEYIDLAKQHIATLEEYLLHVVDAKDLDRKKIIREKIKQKRALLELAISKIYNLEYPSMEKPWIMDIFDEINQAVLKPSAKRFRDAVAAYNKKSGSQISAISFAALEEADDLKKEIIKRYARSLSRKFDSTEVELRNNAAQLIPPYLDQLYSHQLAEENPEFIYLEKSTILNIIFYVFESPSNPYAHLITDIISSEGILDIEKRHACLLLLNEQGNFYPKIKSDIAKKIVANIAKNYDTSSHQKNFKQQQDQFIAQAIKCLTILPTMEPIFSGTLPISSIGDGEFEDYLDKITLLEQNINDPSIKAKLEEISKNILDESTKRLNVRIAKPQPVVPEIPHSEEPANPDISTSGSSEVNLPIEEEYPLVHWSGFDERVAAEQGSTGSNIPQIEENKVPSVQPTPEKKQPEISVEEQEQRLKEARAEKDRQVRLENLKRKEEQRAAEQQAQRRKDAEEAYETLSNRIRFGESIDDRGSKELQRLLSPEQKNDLNKIKTETEERKKNNPQPSNKNEPSVAKEDQQTPNPYEWEKIDERYKKESINEEMVKKEYEASKRVPSKEQPKPIQPQPQPEPQPTPQSWWRSWWNWAFGGQS